MILFMGPLTCTYYCLKVLLNTSLQFLPTPHDSRDHDCLVTIRTTGTHGCHMPGTKEKLEESLLLDQRLSQWRHTQTCTHAQIRMHIRTRTDTHACTHRDTCTHGFYSIVCYTLGAPNFRNVTEFTIRCYFSRTCSRISSSIIFLV